MPSLSVRATQLPASPIRKLVPFAEAAGRRGIKVYHLNIGQPDIATPPEFFAAIGAANPEVLEYSHSAGIEPLRQRIVDYYGRWNQQLDLSQVIVTTGASEALSMAFSVILNPDDEVIVPEPFYANYISFALANSGRVIPVPTHIENDFSLPSADAFESRITSRTRAIMICNPGNPTGVIYPRSALEALGEIVVKHDLFLIVDEVYREFNYSDQAFCTALDLPGLQDRVIIVDSISKRFSACGARIGCIVSRNADLMDAVLRLAQARLSPPTLGQIGATAVYQLPTTYYQQVIDQYARRRDLLRSALAQMPGVVCPAIDGAFYAMVKLPVANSDHFCQWMLEKFDHRGATVMMAPGGGFYATEGSGQDQVRIAYVLKENALTAAMEALAAGLVAYPGADQ